MDIIEKIKDIDCYLKNITASRPDVIHEDVLRQFEIKRDVSHEVNLPKRKSEHFSVEVTDSITFSPKEGPFKVEIVIGAAITLSEPMTPGEITKLINIQKNKLSIINQCLPHSSSITALITDKMGFSPVIFSSRIAMDTKEFTNASRVPGRRKK
ncbi:MAG: hypothetical protein HZA08_09400 [Nitrospirae bacterium]|nr:hypothetical protein [Nitrospirota bacterium]